MGILHFVKVDLGVSLGKLSLRLLECNVILDSPLIKLLLDTSLADGLVSYIVKLSDDKIVNLLVGVRAHNSIHLGSLSLELQEGFHELRSDIFILYLSQDGLFLVNVLINLLDSFVDGHALLTVLLLQFLDEVEHALLIELHLGAEEKL